LKVNFIQTEYLNKHDCRTVLMKCWICVDSTFLSE